MGGESRPRWPEKVSLAGIPDAQVLEGACQLPSWLPLPSPQPLRFLLLVREGMGGVSSSPSCSAQPPPTHPSPNSQETCTPPLSICIYLYIYLVIYFGKGQLFYFPEGGSGREKMTALEDLGIL